MPLPLRMCGKLILAAFGFVTHRHAAGLEIFAIGAARNFEILVLARCPNFDVVGHGAGETHITGAELHDAIVQAEELQDFLSIVRKAFRVLRSPYPGVQILISSTLSN